MSAQRLRRWSNIVQMLYFKTFITTFSIEFFKILRFDLDLQIDPNHNSDLGNRFLALKLAQNEVFHIFLCLLLQKLQLIHVYGGHFGFMLIRKNAQSVHLGIRRF